MRTRVLSTFVRRGLIDKDDATEMRAWAHDGDFSVDGSVRIEGADRTGLERLLRYCARPPFALVLTPLELITKIAARVPPPRAHRHRYYGVLAPNAPLRSVVTALASAAVAPALCVPGMPLRGPATSAAIREEPRHRAVARYL